MGKLKIKRKPHKVRRCATIGCKDHMRLVRSSKGHRWLCATCKRYVEYGTGKKKNYKFVMYQDIIKNKLGMYQDIIKNKLGIGKQTEEAKA